ncbi:HAD family hydrolase [Roseovarius sp. SCSIO 43702]|uniref:sulfotransferase-like domain-containing protein n=1 Tax=Roseovarius sp. SCSIO 43702 TaxID=2823043 RepID=UPI001C72D5F4|nr:HAD family hydrolase [Roseovarius sp. SCSIO 43702]QYX57007.1 HAD family hydrolase [Roseovarius sp. SCSIO 43702]
MRIAMWSGPRNLSTAMMYSFGARGDCAVVDEPFYAAYLALTGLEHPMRDEVMASQPQDPEDVITSLTGSLPEGRIQYQKHMSQHMVEGVRRDWIGKVRNVFLIRHPARVIASYAAKRENPTLDDIGFRQQAELFDEAAALGDTPVVVDSHDIREAPEPMLRRLCDEIGIRFDPAMLSWPKGGHPADGVWAAHWYGAVHRSTGFAGPEGPLPRVDGPLRAVMEAAMPCYERLKARALTP